MTLERSFFKNNNIKLYNNNLQKNNKGKNNKENQSFKTILIIKIILNFIQIIFKENNKNNLKKI